ncbi:hypothetical protein GCM10027612_49300 [Microbispora bryophytorum subsp. camponoti]
MLGLGFGGVPRPGITPLAAMAGYLDEMDGLTTPNPLPRTPMRRILAAYGPKMLELARDRSAGALTYHVTVAHTAQAREILGPDAFLGVEHAVLFESDPARARAAAREHLHRYLNTPYNIAKFRRLGYADEEITGGGSDRLIDDLVFWGDLDTIVAKLRAHLDAGADHVAIQVIGIEPGRSALPYWRMLGDALLPSAGPGAPASDPPSEAGAYLTPHFMRANAPTIFSATSAMTTQNTISAGRCSKCLPSLSGGRLATRSAMRSSMGLRWNMNADYCPRPRARKTTLAATIPRAPALVHI